MSRKRTLLIAWLCSGSLLPAAAVEWEAVPALPPIPTPWQSVQLGSKPDIATRTRQVGLDWQLDPEPSGGINQLLALAWESVASGQEIDVEQELARQSEPGSLLLSTTSPFRPFYYTPNIGGAQISAYRLQWKEGFVSGSAATPGNQRDGVVDGSVNFGLGLGDPDRFAALELNWNIGSTNNFNANGSFDIRAGRVLAETPRWQFTAGGGVLSLYTYGTETGRDDANGFGVLTAATVLRPNNQNFPQLLQFSAGIGGNRFASINDQFQSPDLGYFLALGMEISPNLGASIGRSGRGTNLLLSYLPNRDTPLYLDLAAVNIFDENPYGTIGVLRLRFGGRQLYR